MRRSADIDALQQVLSAALGSREPVCSLARLGRDADAFAALDPAVLERPTLVGGGSPYHPTSPVPAPHTLDELARRADELNVAQILVPNVRRSDDTGALRAAGLVPLATQSECVVRLPGEVDEVLRARVGAGRLHDLRRHHHAVSCDITWERIPLTELDGNPWAKDAFVELHRRRTERHGGQQNLYNADALDALAHGALADRTEMLVRRSEKTVVQAGLITTSHNGRGLYYLTQATDHDDPAARNNLHVATLYELYCHARRSGLEWVHLGRGTPIACARSEPICSSPSTTGCGPPASPPRLPRERNRRCRSSRLPPSRAYRSRARPASARCRGSTRSTCPATPVRSWAPRPSIPTSIWQSWPTPTSVRSRRCPAMTVSMR
ncbi:hypothetical protein SANT12839_004870 [Streptomyces antimycoticus]|uniref:BioF2-like acetyltransferase domain-containing protein n=1 Tax=Streptomyces antimycoticus TaxID=68175 RepID=A0A4D4JSE4_9ACTN|nr:GNAT family N-acetyltransferase [Streptomyces antimycoticus]GDY39605.1 hypothetical protein SANT12839_004870 [Streptomyces antimycoticus]